MIALLTLVAANGGCEAFELAQSGLKKGPRDDGYGLWEVSELMFMNCLPLGIVQNEAERSPFCRRLLF